MAFHAVQLIMKQECRTWQILFVILLSSALVNCAKMKISPAEFEQKVDAFVGELLRCRKFTAANVAIVSGNTTLLSKGYGVVDMTTNNSVTNQTLFGIASLSKAFTAALLGIVLESSPYTWDTDIRTILGEDFFFYDAERTNGATLRDLLTHRMGYQSYNNMRHQSGLDRRTLAKKMRFLKPTIPFRTQFKYNNIMYGLLAHMAEVIGGDTWEALTRRHIFEPLGMTSTGFTHEVDLTRPDLTRAYQVDYDGNLREVSPQYHSYWGKIGGSGSIVSNSEDMLLWLKCLLDGGKNQFGDQVIPSDVIDEAHTRFESIRMTTSEAYFIQPYSPVSFSHFEYGLAWRLGYYRGWRTVLHTGTSMGYLAQLTLVSDLDIGIHSSFGGDDPGHTGRRLLHIYILDLLMGEEPWLNLTDACSFPQTKKYRNQYNRTPPSKAESANDDLELYVGTYGNFGFGNVSFYVNTSSGSLMMSYGDFGLWILDPLKDEHNFRAVGIDHVWLWIFDLVQFSRSSGGDTGPIDRVSIPSLEKADGPVFIRDSKMADAPAPPDIECEISKAHGVSVDFVASTILVLIVLFS